MQEANALASVAGDVHVGAATVHWRRAGSGPSVVLLHGFPLSGRTWDAVVLRLRDRFTCYTPDLIGLGRSHSSKAEDHSSPGQARALRAALAQLGVDSYALVGNDTGGWIARELALIEGPRVSRLVLTDTEIPFHRPPWIPTYQAVAPLPGSAAILRLLLRSRTFRRSPLGFGGCFHDPGHLDGDFHERFVAPLIASPSRLAGALQFLRQMKFSRLDEFHRLHARLTLPTLFVWAAGDPTFPVSRAREMLGQFPNAAGFHEVRNARLLLHAEQPDEVARLVGHFLSGPRP